MKRKFQPIDDDALTPAEKRGLDFGIAQSNAGLTYGPFEKGGISLQTFLKRNARTRRVSPRIPEILFDYLKQETKQFGMTPGSLMATILETHQFKDRDRQMIGLAIERAARDAGTAKPSRAASDLPRSNPMTLIPIQRRMAVLRPEPEGDFAIRVSHRAERKRGPGHISSRYSLRCGCCDQAVQIYYDTDGLEINGVNGSLENWREILLPLLRMRRRGKCFTADAIQRRMPKFSPKRASK